MKCDVSFSQDSTVFRS